MPFLQPPQPDRYTYQRPTEQQIIGLLVSLGYRPYLFQPVSGSADFLVWSKTLYQEMPTGKEIDTIATRKRILKYMGTGSISRLPASLDVLREWFDHALVIFETPEGPLVLMQLGEGVTNAIKRESEDADLTVS